MSCASLVSALSPRFGRCVAEALDKVEHATASALCARLVIFVTRSGVRTARDALRLLSDERSQDEWILASWLLQANCDRALVSGLIRAMHSAKSPMLRHECLTVLASTRGDKARDAIVATLNHDPDGSVRFRAAHTLASFHGDRAAIRALLACLDSTQEEGRVRGEAARSLGLIADRDVEQRLIDALSDESPDVRYWAADALGSVGGAASIAPLQELAGARSAIPAVDGDVRESASVAEASVVQRLNEGP